jgi:hypothetical protein
MVETRIYARESATIYTYGLKLMVTCKFYLQQAFLHKHDAGGFYNVIHKHSLPTSKRI